MQPLIIFQKLKMILTMRKITFIAVILFSSLHIWAYDFWKDGLSYEILDGNKVAIVSGDYGITNLVIPSSVRYENKTYSVTEIWSGAFQNHNEIIEVTIPSSVTYIGEEAFEGCSMTEVTIPKTVKEIGPRCFWNISSLHRINVKEGNSVYDSRNQCGAIIETATNTLIVGGSGSKVPDGITAIGDYAFSYCSLTHIVHARTMVSVTNTYGEVVSVEASMAADNLGILVLPTTVKSIGKNAFSWCKDILKVDLPFSVTSIDDGAFCGCEKLEEVTLPAAITHMGSEVFLGTTWFNALPAGPQYAGKVLYACKEGETGMSSTIMVKEGTIAIASKAFKGCNYIRLVILPSSIKRIGSEAFEGCSYLGRITLPAGIQNIEFRTFAYCSELKSITLPVSLKSIGNEVFYHCRSLQNLALPTLVTKVGKDVFYGCRSLTEVSINYSNTDKYFAALKAGEIPLLGQTLPLNITINNEVVKTLHIPNNVDSLLDNSLAGFAELDSLYIPLSVKSIGSGSLRGVKSLDAIIFTADSLEEYLASTINAQLLHAGVESPRNLFINGQSVTELVIPGSLEVIKNGVFSYLSALTSVVIEDGITSIDTEAFEGCIGLQTIYMECVTPPAVSDTSIPSDVKTICVPESMLSEYQNSPQWMSYYDKLKVCEL